MKNIFRKKLALVAIFTLFFATACEDYLGDGINENPNSPTSVPVTVLLPNIEVNIADVTGGDFSRFSAVLVQQTEGVARQWTSINDYSSMNPATFNTTWNNIYENILIELNVLKAQAQESGLSHYEGVANILTAYTIMMATDVWDDIPFSDAFQGIDKISAEFDTQAEIYAEVNTLLTSGISLLQGSDGGVALGSADVMYAGDLDKWAKAANSILARMHLHQGEYAQALAAAGNGFTSADDDLQYLYTDAVNSGQWYRFNIGRTGDIEFHPTMRGIMTDLNDTTRLAVMDQTFVDGHPYFVQQFEQELISYRELKFIEAECLSRTSGSATAIRDAYLTAIEESFDHIGSMGYATYITQPEVDPAGGITLDEIMIQKYIGLFTQPEVYNDYRRTDIPSLTPTDGGSAVLVRWPYGNDEILFNENAPEEDEVDLRTDRVGWDR
ncbi:MAG: SusD/RagB family nutrient-binding outer membrane lipoprotein [Bacteroidota bacterium]